MSQALITLLNHALRMEYSDVFLYPRHADHLQKQPAIAELFRNFSQMEVRHADVLANAISRLGGQPNWDFHLLTGKKTFREIVNWHLAGERAAIKLYRKCIGLVTDKRFKDILELIRLEETIHEAALVRISQWIK